jgi:hypothetical protein
MEQITAFFNHPFFIIMGGLTTLFSIIVTIYILVIILNGLIPVWYRLGMGLSKRKIAVFAIEEYDNLSSILEDSKIFSKKNIIKIDINSIKKANEFSLILVHWNPFREKINDILDIKKDKTALIIYAPQDEGLIDADSIKKINAERNSIIVNMRGRLLNDILTCMITTSYE